jgi:ubiquinone/menaquinone biosynthesis C-methylase UbiE
MADCWWTSLYDDHVANVLLERTSPADVERTTDFLVAELELGLGSTALDQCCGTGRIAWALAKRGVAVLGVDIVPSYVRRALRREVTLPNGLSFEPADAFVYRAIPCRDAAFNWWTSFGYAAADDDNLRMLARARESIRPGGRYALDFMNVPGIYRNFRPRVVTEAGGVTLVRDSTIDLDANVMHKAWTFTLADGRRFVRNSAVRLYDPAALRRLFLAAGFDDVRIRGDVDGSPLTLDSPRCIVLGRNPP